MGVVKQKLDPPNDPLWRDALPRVLRLLRAKELPLHNLADGMPQ